MKFTLYAVCIALTLALATASDAGYFMPSAYYTIDSEGHVSNLQPIAPQLLRRIRRESSASSSSYSSSSASNNGGPILFTSHHTETHAPGFGATGGVAAAGGGVSFDSRFSDDSPTGGSSFGNHPASTFGSGIGSGARSGGSDYASHSGGSFASGSGIGSGSGGYSSRHDDGTYTSRNGDTRPVFGSRYVGASSSGSISTGPNFESRFGETSSVISNEGGRTRGRTVTTTGYIDKAGRVHQKTSETHL